MDLSGTWNTLEAGAGANICWEEQLVLFEVLTCSRQTFLIWVVFAGGMAWECRGKGVFMEFLE